MIRGTRFIETDEYYTKYLYEKGTGRPDENREDVSHRLFTLPSTTVTVPPSLVDTTSAIPFPPPTPILTVLDSKSHMYIIDKTLIFENRFFSKKLEYETCRKGGRHEP
jgi:hypothetical protein